MSPAGPRDWWTVRDLAALAEARGLAGYGERRLRALAAREGWAERPGLARLAVPAGGGRPHHEYHADLLPGRLRALVHGTACRAAEAAAQAAAEETDRRRAVLQAAALPAAARATMEARAEVLAAIDGHAAARATSRGRAIAAFLAAQEVPATLASSAGFGLDPARLAAANDRRGAPAISRATLYSWFAAREAGGVAALAPRPPKAEAPVPAVFRDFMRFYARPSKPTTADAHRQWSLALGGPAPLSLGQVRRILKERLNHIERATGREGLLVLKARLAHAARSTADLAPTAIYTADGKTFDAEVADPVSGRPMRPEITSVLDVATRKCVGWAVSRKENVIAVTEGLRRACAAHGIPAIFYTDRGPGYRNKTFDADVGGLMGRLGITKMHALPYNSQAKGIVERFGAIWNDVARRMPSYIGRDMDREAAKAQHRATRDEIRRIGTARDLPGWQAFAAAVEAEIAAYNDRPHRGLPRIADPATGRRRHMSPNEAWEAHVAAGFVPVRILPGEEDDLFRPYELRRVRRAAVEWNTNTYFHASLEPRHGERVAVGYDLNRADRVWVRAFDVETGQPGALICVAAFAGNATRYVARSFEDRAGEERSRTAIKRLERKRADREAERDGPALVAHRAEVPLPPAPEPTAAIPVRRAGARPVFRSDEELALWALAHPDDLSPGQAEVLRDCIARPAARDHFRVSGIDVEALRTLLRGVA